MDIQRTHAATFIRTCCHNFVSSAKSKVHALTAIGRDAGSSKKQNILLNLGNDQGLNINMVEQLSKKNNQCG